MKAPGSKVKSRQNGTKQPKGTEKKRGGKTKGTRKEHTRKANNYKKHNRNANKTQKEHSENTKTQTTTQIPKRTRKELKRNTNDKPK